MSTRGAMVKLNTVGKILQSNMGGLSMELKKRKVSNAGSLEHPVRLAVATFPEILLECRARMELFHVFLWNYRRRWTRRLGSLEASPCRISWRTMI